METNSAGNIVGEILNPFAQEQKQQRDKNTLDKEGLEALRKFESDLMSLNSNDIPYQEKLDLIVRLSTQITPLIFRQLLVCIE